MSELAREVQDILNDPALTPKNQAEKLQKANALKFVIDNFRVSSDLADSIKQIASKGPSITTKLKSITQKGK